MGLKPLVHIHFTNPFTEVNGNKIETLPSALADGIVKLQFEWALATFLILSVNYQLQNELIAMKNHFKFSLHLFLSLIFIMSISGNTVFGSSKSDGQVPAEKMTNAEKLGFPKGKTILLLHSDDAGMCEEANLSVQAYSLKNHVQSAAVMMPCPNAEEMVEWAKKHPKADIGVHLTLTSEWKNYRWGSLSDAKKVPGLIDREGKLWRSVPEVVTNATAKEVEIEIRAQIDKMINMGYKPSHIDTHMGTMYASPDFVKVFLKAAEDYNIPANAIDVSDPDVLAFYKQAGYPITDEVVGMIENYTLPKLDNFGSVPDGKSYQDKKNNFFNLVKSLKPGLTEIIFHPSIETENMKSITGSWQQRAWEAEMFSDPEVLEFFKTNDIQLTNWTEIMKMFEARRHK